MSLKSEIQANYIDTYGLVVPYVVPRDIRGSDNGILYTSEYYILLKLLGEATDADEQHWAIMMHHCMLVPGLLGRVPGDTGQTPPDDMYGVLAGAKVLNYPVIAEFILDYGMANYGFYTNSNPGSIKNKDGSINWGGFLWRQPQLLYAALVASNKKRWYHFPLALWTAGVIAISCINEPITSADPRRLSWLLIKTVEDSSWLCKLAAVIWKRRLIKDYGDIGMLSVSKVYYQQDPLHPFCKVFPKY